MNQMQHPRDSANLFERLEQLNQVGVALSKETDINRLLEAILLAAKSIHRLPVHFTLDNEINSQRIGIDDFEFVIPGRVQSGGKFFRQFRGHTAIIRQSGAGEKERTGEK